MRYSGKCVGRLHVQETVTVALGCLSSAVTKHRNNCRLQLYPNYIYFVKEVEGGGAHVFSTNIRDHEIAKKKYF